MRDQTVITEADKSDNATTAEELGEGYQGDRSSLEPFILATRRADSVPTVQAHNDPGTQRQQTRVPRLERFQIRNIFFPLLLILFYSHPTCLCCLRLTFFLLSALLIFPSGACPLPPCLPAFSPRLHTARCLFLFLPSLCKETNPRL